MFFGNNFYICKLALDKYGGSVHYVINAASERKRCRHRRRKVRRYTEIVSDMRDGVFLLSKKTSILGFRLSSLLLWLPGLRLIASRGVRTVPRKRCVTWVDRG